MSSQKPFKFLVKSIEIILEMLRDRKIVINTVIDSSLIKKKIRCNDLNFEFNKNDGSKIKVIYFLNRVKPSTVKNTIEYEYSNNLDSNDEIIFITKETLPQTISKLIDNYYTDKNYFIQIFNIANLQFNITKHNFVPKHELLDNDTANNIITKYNLTSRFHLPHILKKDPIAMYYGMKNGDICKITRKSETAGVYISYRCCR